MNKLMGFFRLKELGIPVVRWERYTGMQTLDPTLLWTVRTAVVRGGDTGLPRVVGVTGEEAEAFARAMFERLGGDGMVVYYPYFIANLSGTMEVARDCVVIECVRGDLWQLVTDGRCDLSLMLGSEAPRYQGDLAVLPATKLEALRGAERILRPQFR